jgi:DNA-directed RNA polymerase II subunit RPB1
MNAHIPQSYEASTELSEIAAVPHQIVTPRHAKPLIGIVQDTLVGSYRITQPHVDFNRREFMNMMMWNKRFEGYMPQAGRKQDGRVGRWTGQQVLSQLMPPINLEMGNGLYKDNKSQENYVKIEEGVVKQGIFDKDIFSKPSKGIVHVTYRDYGPTDTVNFIDSMQNTIEQFLVYNGFSVGVCLSNRNDGEPFPISQRGAAAGVCATLCLCYGIPVDRITTHAAVALPEGRKTDPKGLDLDEFRTWVTARMAPRVA